MVSITFYYRRPSSATEIKQRLAPFYDQAPANIQAALRTPGNMTSTFSQEDLVSIASALYPRATGSVLEESLSVPGEDTRQPITFRIRDASRTQRYSTASLYVGTPNNDSKLRWLNKFADVVTKAPEQAQDVAINELLQGSIPATIEVTPDKYELRQQMIRCFADRVQTYAALTRALLLLVDRPLRATKANFADVRPSLHGRSIDGYTHSDLRILTQMPPIPSKHMLKTLHWRSMRAMIGPYYRLNAIP
jgi:hypothetical protein